MIQTIDNICLIEFVPISEINTFEVDRLIRQIAIDLQYGWTALDASPGSALKIEDVYGDTGRQYQFEWSGEMRTALNESRLLVVRFTLSDGTTFIIGDTDYPVRFEESQTLKSKSIAFTHTSWHYPYTPV